MPQLVTPFGMDQYDNALRLKNLGVADQVKQYKSACVVKKLERLLRDQAVRKNCKTMAAAMNGHDPLDRICQLIEKAAEDKKITSP